LAKKSTESDITLYDFKKDETTITIIEPSRYPDKLASLFYAASFPDYAIIVVEQLDSTFGEILLMLDAIGPQNGAIILRNYITFEQISKIIKNTIIEKYEVINDNPIEVRKKLINIAEKPPKMVSLDHGTLTIDHSFNVKGIGPVVLGVINDGTIKIHDSLKILPTSKKAEIRSIQKHDDNYDTAEKGDRVGVALKGVEVEELQRGFTLTNDPNYKIAEKLEVEALINPYWQVPIKEGMNIHLGYKMQFQMGKIVKYEPSNEHLKPDLNIMLEKPLTYLPYNKAALTYLDGGKLRVMGSLLLK